jgi:hypothetical protein
VTLANWLGSWARASIRGGLDSWTGSGRYGTATGTLHMTTARDRVEVDLRASGWAGPDRFAVVTTSTSARSAVGRRGRVFLAQGGASVASASTPADLWFGGDTGRSGQVPLRAHPLVGDGRLRIDRMGRRIAHASVEARQWWNTASIAVGAAAFVDLARVGRRVVPGPSDQVDVGGGLRLGLPLLDGVFRVDLAKGLRDGATALSFVYEP